MGTDGGRITYSGATYTDDEVIRREQSNAMTRTTDDAAGRWGGKMVRDGLRHVGRNWATEQGVVSGHITAESTDAHR